VTELLHPVLTETARVGTVCNHLLCLTLEGLIFLPRTLAKRLVMTAHSRPGDWDALRHLYDLLIAWSPPSGAAWRTQSRVLADLTRRLDAPAGAVFGTVMADRPRHSTDNIIIRGRIA
jgi:hypothetical protein